MFLQRDGKSSAVTILQEAPTRRVHDPENSPAARLARGGCQHVADMAGELASGVLARSGKLFEATCAD